MLIIVHCRDGEPGILCVGLSQRSGRETLKTPTSLFVPQGNAMDENDGIWGRLGHQLSPVFVDEALLTLRFTCEFGSCEPGFKV